MKHQSSPKAVLITVALPGALYEMGVKRAAAKQQVEVRWGKRVNFSKYVQTLISDDVEASGDTPTQAPKKKVA